METQQLRFELDPPIGVGALRLDMSCESAKQALRAYGDPQLLPKGNTSVTDRWAVPRAATIFVECDADGLVSSIEFATPGFGEDASDQVVFRGIDLFRIPADQVIAALRTSGLRVDESEAGASYTAPDLLLALWRDGGPADGDGTPLFFEAALIAKPGYYG